MDGMKDELQSYNISWFRRDHDDQEVPIKLSVKKKGENQRACTGAMKNES
jgi:hypothetical protein